LTEKPRVKFCWECGNKLYGNHFKELVAYGCLRTFHKECAKQFKLENPTDPNNPYPMDRNCE